MPRPIHWVLEAMVVYLRSQGIPVRKADVGNVSRRDVVEAP